MSAPKTIYDFIDRNNRNTLILVSLFPITLCLLVFAITFLALFLFDANGGLTMGSSAVAQSLSPSFLDDFFVIRQDMTYTQAVLRGALGFMIMGVLPVFALSGIWMIIAYFCGSDMILSASMANPVTRSDSPEIYNLVESVAIAAGLPNPKLYIIRDESLNAFATGRDVNHASITLTTGLIRTLDRRELKAVIGHEMAHIGNRDIRLMLMIIIGIGISSFLADLLFRVITSSRPRSSSNNNGSGGVIYLIILIMAISLAVFSCLIAPLLRFAISRSQEYRADATSALITRTPDALASALEKISRDSRVEALDNMPSVGALCIANPLGKENRKRLFDALSGLYATHPPIQKRIQALRTMDGRQ